MKKERLLRDATVEMNKPSMKEWKEYFSLIDDLGFMFLGLLSSDKSQVHQSVVYSEKNYFLAEITFDGQITFVTIPLLLLRVITASLNTALPYNHLSSLYG